MLGSGKWTTRNKILPGVYIRIASEASNVNIIPPEIPSEPEDITNNHAVLGLCKLAIMVLGKSNQS